MPHTRDHAPQSNRNSTPAHRKKTVPPLDTVSLLEVLDHRFINNVFTPLEHRCLEPHEWDFAIAENERLSRRMARKGISRADRDELLTLRLAIVFTLSAPEFPFVVSKAERRLIEGRTDNGPLSRLSRKARTFEIADLRVAFCVSILFPNVSRQTASRYALVMSYFKERLRTKDMLPSTVYRLLGKRTLHEWQGRARAALTSGR